MGRHKKKFGAKKQKTKKNFPECIPWLSRKGLFPECKTHSTRGSHHFPRVPSFCTLKGREFFMDLEEEFFSISSSNGAVCLGRQETLFFPDRLSSPSVALGEEHFFRVSFFPECQVGYGTRGSLSSPSTILPREQHSGKTGFPECSIFGSRGSF